MDHTQHIEVMLRSIKEAQHFLLSHPDPHQECPDHILIMYGLIKLNNTGLYTKLIERWNKQPASQQKKWTEFRNHAITKYEKHLAEGTGPTTGKERNQRCFPRHRNRRYLLFSYD